MLKFVASACIIIFFNTIGISQCLTGSEPECKCGTAEVLCSVGDLDGYSNSLAAFSHPGDGPSPFCGSNFTDNPGWFGFLAWCEDITLEIEITNCSGGSLGAQLVVFTDCSFSEEVDCNDDCNNNVTVILDLNNLTIGEDYFLMLDGCGGSECDYMISVTSAPCDETIEDWTDTNINGDLEVCIGEDIQYTVEDLVGATNYHWSINGVEVDVTNGPDYNVLWDMAGSYQLCVDVSNSCVEITEDPDEICVTVEVSNPNAGTISVTDNNVCPDEFIDINVQGYNDDAAFEEHVIIVDENGEVVAIYSDPNSASFTSSICAEFKVYSLNFESIVGVPVPSVGQNYSGSDCPNSYCCDEVCFDIIFEDEIDPEFLVIPPPDITVDCFYEYEELGLDQIDDIVVIDLCDDDQIAEGMEVSNILDLCDGGEVVIMWYAKDVCGNFVEHEQIITINPLELPVFIDPPQDITMSSSEYDNYIVETLAYDNDLFGVCEISGTLNPIIEDNRDGCSGSVLVMYEYTDVCMIDLNYTQEISIIPDLIVKDTFLNYCNVDDMGYLVTELELQELITQNAENTTIVYYNTLADLMANVDPLVFPILSDSLGISPVVYASVTDSLGCELEVTIEILANSPPEVILFPTDETCVGANDGSIDFTINSTLPYTILFGQDTITNLTIDNLMPGSYQYVIIDSLGCETTMDTTINNGIDISFDDFSLECMDNGTGTDESDDFYELSFTVVGNTGQYSLLNQTTSVSNNYNYDESVNIQLPAIGNTIDLLVTDLILACTIDTSLFTLLPCSSDCELTIDQLEYNCNDNGTPINPSDDFYEFELLVTALNGGSSNSFDLLVDNVALNSFAYGMTHMFTLPASGNAVTLSILDQQINSCFLTEVTDALLPCSNQCEITLSSISVECNNAGTPSDNSDDVFDISILVEGVNVSSTFEVQGSGVTGTYGDVLEINDVLISNGNVSIEIFDSADNTCSSTIDVSPPAPCSTDCILSLDQLEYNCNDNGTPIDPSDDFYEFEILVTAINGGVSNTFDLEVDNQALNSFEYGMTHTFTLPASGNTVTLTFIDQEISNCILSEITDPLLPCSNECEISLSLISTVCNDAGTPGDNSDDQFDISILVEGVNVSASFEVEGSGETGAYGDVLVINDFLISNGSVTIEIVDGADNTCSSSIEVVPPAPCSSPCEVELGSLEVLDCNDNATGNIASDDFFFINININAILGAGTNYNLTDQLTGIMYGPYDYNQEVNVGPFPADDSNITLLLSDQMNGSCMLEVDFTQSPCSGCNHSVEITTNLSSLDCSETSATLTAVSADNIVVYDWTGPNNYSSDLASIEVTEPGIYEVSVVFDDGCDEQDQFELMSDIDNLIISIDQISVIDCVSGMSCVDVNVDANNVTYSWIDEAGEVISSEIGTYCFEEAGDYSVEIENVDNGCSSSASFVIENPVLPIITLDSIVLINANSVYQLNPILNINMEGIQQIIWSGSEELSCTDCLNATLTNITEATLLNLNIITNDGCTATAEIWIDIIKQVNIYIPNIIRMDGQNRFHVFSNDEIEIIESIRIFDRWGNQVFSKENFQTNNPEDGWDGRLNNKFVEQGVYVYSLIYVHNDEVFSLGGNLTVLR